jgi:hypothetical protein
MKSGKILFNVNKILYINVKYETKTDFVFHPAVEWKQKYICKWLDNIYPFSAIKWGIIPGLPDRWISKFGHPDNFEEDVIIRGNYSYRVDDVHKIVYIRPTLLFQLKQNKSFSLTCDDDDEVEVILHDIKKQRKNPLLIVE